MKICSVVSLVGMAAHEYIFPIPPHTPTHNDPITWILQEFVCVCIFSSHRGVKMTSKLQALHSHLILRCDITGREIHGWKTHSTTVMQAGNDPY